MISDATRRAFNAAAKAACGGAGPGIDPARLGPAWLPNGYYTLTLPCGSHRTLRVHTEQHGAFAGRRLVGLLIGPANTSDYEDFGFVEPGGIKPWKRFVNAKQAGYAGLLWDLMRPAAEGGGPVEGCSVLLSKRCLVCNRPLTTPESYERGIGPTCAKRGRA